MQMGKECASGRGGGGRTEEYLQGVGVQLQVLGLLLQHVRVLRILAVEAVHAGVGQHLWSPRRPCLARPWHLPTPTASCPPSHRVRAPRPRPQHPHPDLASLLQSPAGVTEEGEGFGGWHLVDGRHTVPQAHSELLCRVRGSGRRAALPARPQRLGTHSMRILGPWPAVHPSPSTFSPTQLFAPCSPGPGDGKYISRYSPETASPGELLCSPGRDRLRGRALGCSAGQDGVNTPGTPAYRPSDTSPRPFHLILTLK